MLKLNFSDSATGARAVFNRHLAADSRIKDDVVTLDTIGTFFDAVDKGIKAEVATGKYRDAPANKGGEYAAASRAFFQANEDVHAIYCEQDPPVHMNKRGA